MAFNYLNVDWDYFDHPKTRRLVGILGKGAEVLPIKLWCYCGKYHCEEGKLSEYSAKEIESIVGWWGKEGQMVQAMIKVKFLQEFEDGYIVNDWLDHEGHINSLKVRGKKAADKRWSKLKDDPSNALSNAKEDVEQCSTYLTNQPPTQLAKTKRGLSEDFGYLKDDVFAESYKDYLDMRNKIRKPATKKAEEIALKHLQEYPLETAIKMLEQSVLNSWQGIFPLKEIKKTSFNRDNYDKLIFSKLGKIATKDMVKQTMYDVPEEQWWRIDKFLKSRYSDGNGYVQAEREVISERSENVNRLGNLSQEVLKNEV